jgi:hypothetical protein
MIGMFLAEGNLGFVRWSSNPFDRGHTIPKQTLDLEVKLGCFGEVSNLNEKCLDPPSPTPFTLTWMHS